MSSIHEEIQILSPNSNVWSVIHGIIKSGQEDAFLVCDLSDVVRKYENWIQKLPRVKPYYAVKCNDSLVVIKTLSLLGANFDCASQGEISNVHSLGITSDRIIFANPTKHRNHIKYAAKTGVSVMTFDNEDELYKIKDLYPNAKMVIRIRYDADNILVKMGNKFGCDPKTDAPHLLNLAKMLNIDVIGVSFHVGSGCEEPIAYRNAIAAAREVFDLAENLGFKFKLLDVGGGYPGYHGESIDEIANIINKGLDDYFSNMNIDIIAEPGRYFVGSAYTLACNIHSTRTIKESILDSKKVHNMYYVNDGIFSCFGGVLSGPYKFRPEPKLLDDNNKSERYSSSIWGQTCDSLDIINEEVQLPQLKCGDWIVFENMGAYTIPIACRFNGFTAPQVLYVIEEKYKHIIKGII